MKPTSSLSGRPVVLIVEDEELLQMVAAGLIENAGFLPLVAGNADAAVSILQERSDISLLFTDIQMPGSMDGLKLAHTVRERWPTVKNIIASGKVQLSEDEMPTESRFFRRPYQWEHLVAALREMVC